MDTWLGHHLPSQAGLGDGGAEGCLAGVVAGASHYGALSTQWILCYSF